MSVVTMIAFQAAEPAGTVEGISAGALVFMLISMGAVAFLTIWCFTRILRGQRHFDPDGTGPAKPPVPGRVEDEARSD